MRYLDYKKYQEERKKYAIFSMKYSNIKFIPIKNTNIVINKEIINFGNEEDKDIPVNKETRELICVGNRSKHNIKIQFSVKEECDKYEIRTNPEIFTIPPKKAIEIEIFIKPLCTCSGEDFIVLINKDMKKGK